MYRRIEHWLTPPLRRLMFWSWWTLCSVLYLIPMPEKVSAHVWDKAAHASTFTVMMLLAALVWLPRRPWWQLAAWLVAYGYAIECLQGLTSWRSYSLLDLFADAVGVALALPLIGAIHFIDRRLPS